MRIMLRVACIVLSAFLFLWFLNACEKGDTKTIVEEKAYNVLVLAAERKPLRPFVEAIGTLNPYDEVTVSTEIDGILKDLLVDEGAKVSKGMLLAAIDDTDYTLEVKRAEAALRQSEATSANIQIDNKRKVGLYEKQLIAKQEIDDVSTRLALAEAEVDRAKAALSLARQKLSKAKILSPLAGFVRMKKVSKGEFVKNGNPLLIIIQSNPIKLRFTVTERDMAS